LALKRKNSVHQEAKLRKKEGGKNDFFSSLKHREEEKRENESAKLDKAAAKQ
jgi:hypothetical protein